jgi:hypothetical protein
VSLSSMVIPILDCVVRKSAICCLHLQKFPWKVTRRQTILGQQVTLPKTIVTPQEYRHRTFHCCHQRLQLLQTADRRLLPPRAFQGKPLPKLHRISKIVVPIDPAELKRHKKAREEGQRWVVLANLFFMAPGTEIPDGSNLSSVAPVQAPAAGPTEGQLMRNQALASN